LQKLKHVSLSHKPLLIRRSATEVEKTVAAAGAVSGIFGNGTTPYNPSSSISIDQTVLNVKKQCADSQKNAKNLVITGIMT
jgi:hypothetical protein